MRCVYIIRLKNLKYNYLHLQKLYYIITLLYANLECIIISVYDICEIERNLNKLNINRIIE